MAMNGGTDINGFVTSTWTSSVDAQIVAVFHDSTGNLVGGTFNDANAIPASGQQSFNIPTIHTIPPDWTPTFYATPNSLPSRNGLTP